MNKPHTWLVETDWLAEHLGVPGLVILDASFHLPGTGRNNAEEFHEAHIPGALLFDIDDISDTSNPLPHMLPPPAKFASRMRKMGIGDGMRIVTYDATNMSGAARAWWMFRVMGVTDVVVLNGGLKKWRAEDRPIASGPSSVRTERHFIARMNSGLVRDLADMSRLIDHGGMDIVDARPLGRFAGTEPEPRDAPRLGHLPGAKNIPFTDLLAEDGTLRPPADITAIFSRAAVDPKKPVVASCGSGVTACLIALALSTTGNDMTSVYDGSWAEWSASGKPIETGSNDQDNGGANPGEA